MVIAPGGEVLYKKEGKIDILEVRRTILAAMPDTKGYIGSKAYWVKTVAELKTQGQIVAPACSGACFTGGQEIRRNSFQKNFFRKKKSS